MISFRIACLLPLLLCPCLGQSSQTTPPNVVQEKVRQWVEAKKTLAAERASWAEEKQRLTELNTIRRAELSELQAMATNMTDRLDAAVAKRADLESTETSLKTELAAIEQRVAAWETTLRPKLATLPQPLLDTLAEPIGRLQDGVKAPVENRMRDLVFVLAEISAFHHDVRIHRELQEIGGASREVDVLYLGLAQAFYVNKNGTLAGRGQAGPDGWTWSARNDLAADIRSAIDMSRKDRAPGMLRLPISPASGGAQ